MKIALITDTHFGARNDNLDFNEYFFKFYEGVFFPYLAQNNIKACIHLGDVMDRRKYVSYRIAKDFRERFLQPFDAIMCDLHMIVGNHDTFYRNTNDVNSLRELCTGRGNRIKFYEEATEVEFDGLPVMLLPWINAQNYVYTEGMIDQTKATVAFGHLEIDGFEMHAGHYCEGGFKKEMFRKFDTVFSGHFHHKSDDGHIYYLGNPYEITWSDYNDKRGFHIFDTDTLELEFIPNPYTMFDKIFYDDTTTDYEKVDVSKYEKKYIKVVVVNKKDLYQFDRFIERLLKANTHDVKIVEDFSDLHADTVSDDIAEYAEDTQTLLHKYIDDLQVSFDKERLKNLMRGLYTEAQDLEI